MELPVEPRVWLWEVIWVTSAIWPRLRSSGVATVAAITSGLAPGKVARTWMVGKSTWGRGATGSTKKAAMPSRAMARVSRVVATGRRMNSAGRFTPASEPRGGLVVFPAPPAP